MLIRALETRTSFIPQFAENLALPENEQIKVYFDKPKAYQRQLWQKTVSSMDSTQKLSAYIELDIKAIIKGSKVEIENLGFIKKDGTTERITTGEQLIESTSDLAYLLSRQIAEMIMKVNLDEVFIKN